MSRIVCSLVLFALRFRHLDQKPALSRAILIMDEGARLFLAYVVKARFNRDIILIADGDGKPG